MEEVGVVISINGTDAVVEVLKKSACDHCTAGTCKVDSQRATLEAINAVGAVPGQRVRVVLQPSSFITGSLMIYGVPVAALIVGAVVGKDVLSPLVPGLSPDGVSALGGFGAMLLSFAIVWLFSKFAGRKQSYKPVIEAIVEHGNQFIKLK